MKADILNQRQTGSMTDGQTVTVHIDNDTKNTGIYP